MWILTLISNLYHKQKKFLQEIGTILKHIINQSINFNLS